MSTENLEPPDIFESILIVDDDVQSGRLLTAMLASFVDDVVFHEHAAEALKLIEREPERFDFVIVDLQMPYMTGEAFAKIARILAPDLKFVLMSAQLSECTERYLFSAYIEKPITPESLINAMLNIQLRAK